MNELDMDSQAVLARFVRAACPPWLRYQLDDLTQMAAIKIIRGAEQPPYGPAFLRRVAYSIVIDELRRLRRNREVQMSPSLPDRIANSNDLSPETRARGAEVGAELVKCVEQLIPSRRRAVVLYLQDLDVPEIARRLQVPRKKASNLVYRGLADLRELLSQRGIEP